MSEDIYSALAALDGSIIILFMTASGALATHLKALDKEGCESISRMLLNILLPCLIFTETVKNIDVLEIQDFGLIFFFCTFQIIIGFFIGLIFSLFQKNNQDLKKIIIACIGFQDSLIIPLLFVNVIQDDKDLKKKSIGYILTYTLFNTIYTWMLAYKLLKRSPKVEENVQVVNQSVTESPVIVNVGRFSFVRKNFNFPLAAAIVALVLAAVPYAKEYVLCGSGAVFTNNLFAAMVNLGNCVAPLLCIILGSNVSKGFTDNADVSRYCLVRKIIGMILVGRFFFVPLAGLGIVYLMRWQGVINRAMALTILIIYICPSSLQLLIICLNHRSQIENISKIFLAMYMFTVIPLASWTMIFLLIF